MTQILEQPKTSLQLSGEKISTGLIAFEKRKSSLTELKESAIGLEINGVDDKKGLEAVAAKRKELKAERVLITKEGKLMRDDLTKMNKMILERENELVNIIEPTEQALQAKEDAIAGEKEKIRLEIEAKETQRVQERLNKLFAFGFQADYNEIKAASDLEFDGLLEEARTVHKSELAAKAEAQRLADEQAEKLKAEREELDNLRIKQAEAQRIIDENNERIKAEQERLEAENKRQEAEKERLREETEYNLFLSRANKFLDIEIDGKRAYSMYAPLALSYNDIISFSDGDFETVKIEFNGKVLKEKEERAAEKKRIAEKAEADRHAEIEGIKQKAAEDARLKLKKEAEEKAEKELADKKEAERLAALAPDKQKLQAFADFLSEIKPPAVKDEKAKLICERIQELINKTQSYIINNIKAL